MLMYNVLVFSLLVIFLLFVSFFFFFNSVGKFSDIEKKNFLNIWFFF